MIRLFRVFIPVGSLTLLISEALLLISAFVVATYLLLDVDPGIFLFTDRGIVRILLVVACIVGGIYLHDLYANLRIKSRILLLQELLLVIGIAFLIQGAVSYFDLNLRVPIKVMTAGSALAIGAIFAWRLFFGAFALSVMGSERLLLVGQSSRLRDIGSAVEDNPDLGIGIAGYVEDEHERGTELPGGKTLGPSAELREIVEATRPDRIVVAMCAGHNPTPVDVLLDLRFEGYLVEEMAATYERIYGRLCSKEIKASQVVYSGQLEPRPQNLTLQRWMNLTLAVAAVIVLSPLLAAIALAVRLSSPGPVLERRILAGRGGVPFALYRFRTQPAGEYESSTRPGAVGRFLLKTRLDGAPQLFNVLTGAMSIVGPRPEPLEFAKALSERLPFYLQRFSVKPGITGWTQISYDSQKEPADAVTVLESDLYYIKNMSLSVDTYIIFHALKGMVIPKTAQ